MADLGLIANLALTLGSSPIDMPPVRFHDDRPRVEFFVEDSRSHRPPFESDRPLNGKAFGWEAVADTTSFDWFAHTLLGLVYPSSQQGVNGDFNGDGDYQDNVYILEIQAPSETYQIISLWIHDDETETYFVYTDYLDGLYQGIHAEGQDIYVVSKERKGFRFRLWDAYKEE